MSLSVLIVDDDSEKLRAVTSSVVSVDGVRLEDIVYCSDGATALRKMSSQRFDILILDVVVPLRIDQAASADGGLVLLRQVLRAGQVLMPTYIIGLTSYDDAFVRASSEFVSSALVLLRYSSSDNTWEEAVRSRVRHVMLASQQQVDTPDFDVDVAIVCALETPELAAVRRLPWDWHARAVGSDHALYYEAFYLRNGQRRRVIATSSPRMGLPTAAVVATKVIYTFRPRVLIHCGIAAGIPGRANFGDVIVADPVWDYGSGKWRRVEDELHLDPAPYQIPLSPALREQFRSIASDEAALARIKSAWPADAPVSSVTLRIAPLASGAAVVADDEARRVPQEQNRSVTGIDMEAYAVFQAAQEASKPQPSVAAVKAVVDFADGGKSDDYQRYAAYVASAVVGLFCERFV